MAKKLSAEHIRKMKEGRKKYIARKYGIVCQVADDLVIYLANGNFIVQDGRNKSCCPSIETAMSEVQRILEVRNMLASRQKALSDMAKAIVISHETVKLLMRELTDKLKSR